MEKHTSVETSKKLKYWGFPQPEGFYKKGSYYCISGVTVLVVHDQQIKVTENTCLAPDGTDILKELGRNARASYDEKHKLWDVTYNDGLSDPIFCTETTLAEAAAAVWLIKIKQDRDC